MRRIFPRSQLICPHYVRCVSSRILPLYILGSLLKSGLDKRLLILDRPCVSYFIRKHSIKSYRIGRKKRTRRIRALGTSSTGSSFQQEFPATASKIPNQLKLAQVEGSVPPCRDDLYRVTADDRRGTDGRNPVYGLGDRHTNNRRFGEDPPEPVRPTSAPCTDIFRKARSIGLPPLPRAVVYRRKIRRHARRSRRTAAERRAGRVTPLARRPQPLPPEKKMDRQPPAEKYIGNRSPFGTFRGLDDRYKAGNPVYRRQDPLL